MKPDSEYIKRIKKLELTLKDIHATALNYSADSKEKADIPNEKRYGHLAKIALRGLGEK